MVRFANHQNNQIIFLDFLPSRCGHCKKLTPIFDELGEKMAAEDVEIVKMDATANDVPPQFDVKVQSSKQNKYILFTEFISRDSLLCSGCPRTQRSPSPTTAAVSWTTSSSTLLSTPPPSSRDGTERRKRRRQSCKLTNENTYYRRRLLLTNL